MNYTTYWPANLMSEMNSLFEGVFDRQSFAVDISENDDVYRFDADLPGLSTEEVEVRVEENLLIIEGRPAEKEKTMSGGFRLRERRIGTVKRSFVLPDNVDRSAVEAKMTNGILTVTLQKRAETKPLLVKIKS